MFELAIAVTIVIVVSATCSLFEAVLYSVPISHIQGLVQAERPAGLVLQELRKDVDRPITAILALNTVANTAGAAVAGALAVNALGNEWLTAFSAFFTIAILLFSEVIPKTAGVVYCRGFATIIAYPLKVMVFLFTPVIWICSTITTVITGKRKEDEVSPRELIVLARLSLEHGNIVEDEAAVIENILALRGKSVRDVLTPRPVVHMLQGAMTVAEAAKDPKTYQFSRIPIYFADKDDVVGFVHRKDILAPMAEDKDETPLAEMAEPLHFVLQKTPLNTLLKSFLEGRQHMFAVIDEFGAFRGVVTLEDILEEILGKQIVDESDVAEDMRELARRRKDEVLQRNKAEQGTN